MLGSKTKKFLEVNLQMEVKVFSDGYYKISLVEPKEDINK